MGLTIPGSGAPHPTVALFVGAAESPVGTHRKAVHTVLDGTNLTIFLRPAAGADIPIYPSAAGLGALLATGTVELLLPMALDALAAMSGDATRSQVAALVAGFGRGLDLVNTPPTSPVTSGGTKLHDLSETCRCACRNTPAHSSPRPRCAESASHPLPAPPRNMVAATCRLRGGRDAHSAASR